MSINASLIGQMITFLIFVWFCMKFIWPQMMKAIRERQKTIADGLSAADKGQRELEAAQMKVAEIIDEAKSQAAEIIDGAQQRANHMVEEAKVHAHQEADKVLLQARAEIEQETMAAKQKLYDEVAGLAIKGAEKIVEKQIDEKDAARLLDNVLAEV